MDFHLLFKSVRELCQNSPVLVILAIVGVLAFFIIILDAHRHKKKRPRHRVNK
ncbi:MAG: hypothetical protein JWR19_3520 [Pedosphaera sp.]|nr:hypothetical protein [Pedosphaera sp.]